MTDGREWGMPREELIAELELNGDREISEYTEEELWQRSWKYYPCSDDPYYYEVKIGDKYDDAEPVESFPDEAEATAEAKYHSKQNPGKIYWIEMWKNTRGLSQGEVLQCYKGGEKIETPASDEDED